MSFTTKIYSYYGKNRLLIYPLSIATGVPLAIISVIALLYKPDDTGITLTLHNVVGDWAYWIIIIGLILVLFGGYNIVKFLGQLKEFKTLMDTTGRVKFIKNQDRIEELAWRLHPKYEKQVIDRKAKFNIK